MVDPKCHQLSLTFNLIFFHAGHHQTNSLFLNFSFLLVLPRNPTIPQAADIVVALSQNPLTFLSFSYLGHSSFIL